MARGKQTTDKKQSANKNKRVAVNAGRPKSEKATRSGAPRRRAA